MLLVLDGDHQPAISVCLFVMLLDSGYLEE